MQPDDPKHPEDTLPGAHQATDVHPSGAAADEASQAARHACALFAVGLLATVCAVGAFLLSERSALRRADVERVGMLSERSTQAIVTRVQDRGGFVDDSALAALRSEVARIAEVRGVLQVALLLDDGDEVITAQSAEAREKLRGVTLPSLDIDGPGRTLGDDHLLVTRQFRIGAGAERDAMLVIRSGYPGLEMRMRDLVSLAGRIVGMTALLLVFLAPVISRWLSRRSSAAARRVARGETPVVGEVMGGGFELVTLVERIEEDAERIEEAEQERVAAARAARREIERVREELREVRTEVDVARRDAQTANAAKAAFVANTSHEVRTPLHAVLGSTSLLLETGLDAEQRALAERNQRAAELLLTLVEDVLDLARFDTREIQLDPAPFDAGALVEEVAELSAASAAAKGLEVGTFVSPECPRMLVGDARRIRQALMRLVDNGVKFTEKGEVTVELGWEVFEDGYPRARFTVTDTGPGVSAEERARLFDAFEQLDASDTRRHGGVGLGLALVARIARASGGEVLLDSHPGRGSRFTLLLPLGVDAQERGGIAQRVTQRRRPLQGRSILLVDDAPASTMCFARTLEVLGATVQIESSTYAGFEAWVRASFDVVMIGARLAGRDAFLGAVESNENRAPAPVVLLTPAMSGRAPRESCDEAVAAMAAKPLSRAGIEEVLVRVLAPEEAEAAARAARRSEPEHLLESGLRERIRILLVEDNQTNQQLVQYVLGKRGYRVDVASNGRLAVDAFTVGTYDAILMDCQMPEMDGYEATRRIRELEAPRGTRTPILAMTAGSLEGDGDKCREAGMDDMLTKPFQPHQMVRWLEGWLLRTASNDGEKPSRPRVTRAEAMASLEPGRMGEPAAPEAEVLRAVDELTEMALEVSLPGPVVAPTRAASEPAQPPAAPAPTGTEPAAPGAAPTLDLAGVLDDSILGPLFEDEVGTELANELVESFLEVAPERMAELEQAVASDDLDACARIAHAMVSTSGTVGAMRLARLLRELERMAEGGSRDDSARLLGDAQREVTLAQHALQQPRG